MPLPESPGPTPAPSLAERAPVTAGRLQDELCALGVEPGMLLMAHCALRPLGFVLGGPAGLYQALAAASNVDGADSAAPRSTILMPAFDRNNSEPSRWQSPPLAEEHWQAVRDSQPAFDLATTPGVQMGALGEYFRTLPDTLRSSHPHVSWCGRGPQAAAILARHSLDFGLGEESPLGECYRSSGFVLSMGTLRTTVLHLAEHRCEWAGKAVYRQGSALLVDGRRQWAEYDMLTDDNADFEELRQAYRKAGGAWREGPLGEGTARLIPIRPLVDFAVQWLPGKRVG